MSEWARWIMSWRRPVNLFALFTSTISCLYGNQRDKILIEQDIEGGQKGSLLNRKTSHENHSTEQIGPKIHELQNPICTTSTTQSAKTTLTNHYDNEVRIILGAGTSSVVYKADEDKAEKRFESCEDLLNEQAIYEILGSHPRLLSIYQIKADSIIMDWMKKGDLACFFRSYPEITERRKYQWITQIAESFCLLHKHQISHCDSKLENFLLDDNYNIKICDFASSHNYRAPSNDLAIQPLRYRRAVDDFDEAIFNPADDIFAFGSISYEIVTGGPPYPQLDDESVRLQFTRGDFPATEDLSFGAIIRDCWNGKVVSFEAILGAIEEGGQAQILL